MQLRVIERAVIVGAVPDKQHLDLNIRGPTDFFEIKAANSKIKGIIHQVFGWKGPAPAKLGHLP
jgi:hypothetical protein